jgi:Mg2+-importing ATPase
MLLILKVDVGVFRTAWFVESSISEMIVTFAIRTKYPFYKSKPSHWLLMLTFISIVFVVTMPFTSWGAFEFKSLGLYVWILIIFDLISYFTVTELVKKRFFQKFERENS